MNENTESKDIYTLEEIKKRKRADYMRDYMRKYNEVKTKKERKPPYTPEENRARQCEHKRRYYLKNKERLTELKRERRKIKTIERLKLKLKSLEE